MAILTGDHHAEVRAAISLDLVPDKLPANTIDLDIYLGAAEREVIRIDADAESRTGDEAAIVRTCAIYLTAAKLCPAVAYTLSIQMSNGQQNYNRNAFNPEKRAAELRASAYEQLNELLEDTAVEAVAMPTMFTKAIGRRGR